MRSCPNVVGLLCALALATLRDTSADAQARRPLTLVDLAEMPRLLDPQLSPDGRFVAYTLARADWQLNRPVAQVWRQAVAGGQPEQLTRRETGVVPSVQGHVEGRRRGHRGRAALLSDRLREWPALSPGCSVARRTARV